MGTSQYATLLFDCDGVILDSNKVKTAAFFEAALPYGELAAAALVDYHQKHGGVSRYRKFEYFLEHIVGIEGERYPIEQLLESFAREVRKGLLTCRVNPALEPLRAATPNSRWMVVSGGDQDELRDLFSSRKLAHLFDGGIFGSPDSKETIIARELSNRNIILPALFIGDSKYDYEAALFAGFDFVFVSEWSEFADWKAYQQIHMFPSVSDLYGLLTPGASADSEQIPRSQAGSYS